MAINRAMFRVSRPWCMVITLSAVMAGSVRAAVWDVAPSIASRLTAQTNTTLGSFQSQSDTALVVRPRLVVTGRGDGLYLTGDVELLSTMYAKGTLPSRLAPQGRVEARWTLVERALALEMEGRIVRTSENPFAAAPVVDPVEGTVTSRQRRVSPVLDVAFNSRTRLLMRSDNTRVGANASTFSLAGNASGGQVGKHLLRLDIDPRPAGLRLEAERSTSKYLDDAQPELRIELARASFGWRLSEDFAVGARWGAETNSVIRPGVTSRIRGAQVRWTPSERTTLNGFREQRFFGDAWRVEFAHRMPRLALNLDFGRTVETGLQSLLSLPATGDVVGLLDAMLTTRFPDAVERARLVREYMAQQGLPEQLSGERTLTSQRISIVTRRAVRLGWNTSSSTTMLSLYDTAIKSALVQDPIVSNLSLRNNRQRGVALAFSQKLSPVLSVNVGADVSEITALQSISDDRRRQAGLRVAMTRSLTARSFLTAGAGWQQLSTTVEEPGSAAQLFVGLNQAF